MSGAFTDRPNVPSAGGDASRIRLSGLIVVPAEYNDSGTKRAVLTFGGAPKDMEKALQAIAYHSEEADDALAITARINPDIQKLEVSANWLDRDSLPALVEFAYNATHCDLALSFTPTYMDLIETHEEGKQKGMVQAHKYYALVTVGLTGDLHESKALRRAVLLTAKPILKKFAQENEHYPSLKISVDRDNGEILVQDNNMSESQPMARTEARELAQHLRELFPTLGRTIS